jgi:hypothetical protein
LVKVLSMKVSDEARAGLEVMLSKEGGCRIRAVGNLGIAMLLPGTTSCVNELDLRGSPKNVWIKFQQVL